MRLHFALAQYYLKNGEPDSQFYHASKSISFANDIATPDDQQKKIYAGALRITGIYYRMRGEYEKAIDYYLKTLNEFEILKDTNGIASTINSMGLAYLALKRWDEAYSYFSRAYELDHVLEKPAKEVADLINMCYALQADGYRPDSIYRKTLRISQDALKLAETLDDKQLNITSLEAVAISLFNLNRFDESMVYQQKALAMAEELKVNALIAEQLYLVAQLYTYKNEYEKAIEYGLRSENIAVRDSLTNLLHDIYNGLSTAYEKAGNWKKAYEYSQKLNNVINSTYQTQIAEQLKRFESERKDNQIHTLSSENAIKENQNQLLFARNEAANAQLQNNRILLFTATGFIILLSALLYILYRNRQIKNKHIQQLEDLNARLNEQKEIISRINTKLELKALRAQMNPHFIFNCMSSIQECMLTNRIDDANTYLTKLSRLMRMVLEYADSESISLDKELEILDLYLKLESVRLKGGFQYSITIDDGIYAEEVQVPTLLLQPFAENAIWHGLLNKTGERCLKINIDMLNNALHCTIEDNGIGREKAASMQMVQKKHTSHGIRLVENRLAVLNQLTGKPEANVVIHDLVQDDGESKGTMVELFLPLI